MNCLLKADFRRIGKDKLLLIMVILAAGFAITTPLLYALIFSGLMQDDMTAAMIANILPAKAQFFASFSLGNNVGFIAPILLAITLCKDFSFGTIRNKIIAGKSRTAIFLSLFITCAVVLIGVMLLHAFLTLGVSLLFFNYQSTEFTVSDLWYFLESLAFEILVLLFVAALLSWLCANMKNAALAIVIYFAFNFGLGLISGIIEIALPILENETLADVLEFINRINVLYTGAYIGTGTEYMAEDVLYLTLPAIIGTLGFMSLGIIQFEKKDLK